MPKQLTLMLTKVKTVASGFSGAQATIAIIGAAVVILGTAFLFSWLSKPTYVPLFSGLSASDASTVVEQLTAGNVPYELADGGASILVPEEHVYAERLTAAAAGLPSDSTGGYSLLDTMGVTSSEFQQSVTYKRALEGELAATIGAMKGVQTASVKLAIPEETVFVATKVEPTASVFIETREGQPLSNDQVNAIVHLTSASIDGMSAQNVAVIDADGSVLSAVGIGTTGSSSDAKTDYELATQAAVQAMLDRILGAGKSTVVVSATVSQESAESITESYERPEGDPVNSESTDTETYTGTGGSDAGVLGPDNIAVPNGGDENGNYENQSSVKDNAINKTTESRVIPAGAIALQTVAVALDESANVSDQQVEALVASAVSIDEERGDRVTVENVTFNQDAAAQAKKALEDAELEEAAARTNDLIRTAIIAGVIALLAGIGLIILFRRSKQKRVVTEVDESELIDTFVLPEPVEQPVVDTVPNTEINENEIRKAEISNLASRDPEKTAAFIRSMMLNESTNS